MASTESYKNLIVQSITPTGAAGARIDSNFKKLADRCYGVKSAEIQNSNYANAGGSVVVGGYSNIVNGNRSVVVGGRNNHVLGSDSVCIGGYTNDVSGDYSIVSGYSSRLPQSAAIGTTYSDNSDCRAITLMKGRTVYFATSVDLLNITDGCTAFVDYHIIYMNGGSEYGKLSIQNETINYVQEGRANGSVMSANFSLSNGTLYCQPYDSAGVAQIGIVASLIGQGNTNGGEYYY
ncbi:MAG: hypothetical protein Q4D62_12375 [Planctomycetia bacterium]|nr:hypothetical protein [Planctomycetia bacterium]